MEEHELGQNILISNKYVFMENLICLLNIVLVMVFQALDPVSLCALNRHASSATQLNRLSWLLETHPCPSFS